MLSLIPLDLFALTLFASVISLVGGVAFLYTKKLSVLLDKYGVPFAAGTMIVTAILGLLPEAAHALGTITSLAIFMIAFLSVYVLEKLFFQVHHHAHSEDGHSKKEVRSSVPIVLIGDTIHNFIDGVALAVAYAINPGLALMTALSTFLHEVPHEIGDFSILRKAGFSKNRVLIINVLSSLVTLLGVVLVTVLSPSETVIGYLLALTGGIFFYLGVVDFLPHAFDSEHRTSWPTKFAGVAAVVAGAIIMAGALWAVPHSHEDHTDEAHAEEEFHSDEQEDDDHAEEL